MSQTEIDFPDTDSGELLVDPIQTTFSGGKEDPFNRWFPYLEGYSPDFVEAILDHYAPAAKRIIDPFGGTATTAFVASERGLESQIFEVNPAMQLLFSAKVRVRTSSREERERVGEQLSDLMDAFERRVGRAERAEDLEAYYHDAFGDSEFFGEENFDEVLRARTLADEVKKKEPFLGKLFTVACLSSLLSSSRLKRAGDVRYMTEKDIERRGIPKFSAEVLGKLRQIRADTLGEQNPLGKSPLLVMGNAKEADRLPPIEADTLITSPPYVNGTNYFRNTKLELWFMRCLTGKDSLARFRKQAVTAGINDVTVSGASEAPHPRVREVVDELAEDPYDRRIPLMAASYFAEMTDVFEKLSGHLKPGATVTIDIGDSIYGGVHIPADELYRECLAQVGYTFEEEVFLRERRSKKGGQLKQVLLVFSRNGDPGLTSQSVPENSTTAEGGALGEEGAPANRNGKPSRNGTSSEPPHWEQEWAEFKSELPFRKRPFSKRNWGHALHSLCSYAGKLKPAIAYHLVKTFVPEGGKMLDPFAGVGTIPFEAALNGRKALGFDLSPAAQTIADAKVRAGNATSIAAVIGRLGDFMAGRQPSEGELAETETFGFNGKVEEYYHDETLREILAAKQFFAEQTEGSASELVVEAACLHLLHGNRPYALSRRSHPITPYAPKGDFEHRPLIPRLRQKVERAFSKPLGMSFEAGRVFDQDATSRWPMEADGLDAVITSPPFYNSTRFHTQNWLRLWFSGWTQEDFDEQPERFVDERQKDGFEVYNSILRQSKERLKTGGVLVLHLGKSKKCNMAKRLAGRAERWFSGADLFDESVAHCESHGVSDKGTTTSHQYLVLH
jgi:DNA modification methylase